MKFEVRNNKIYIDAYANTICRDSEPLYSPMGTFVEQTTEGMWANAIHEAENVSFLVNHNWDKNIANMVDGSLTLEEDNIGLRVRAEIDDPETVEQVKEHGANGFSFGFQVIEERWEEIKDGIKRRFLDRIKLKEVSILLGKTPAYKGTAILSVRDNENIEHRDMDCKVEVIEEVIDERQEQVINEALDLVDGENETKLKLLQLELDLI